MAAKTLLTPEESMSWRCDVLQVLRHSIMKQGTSPVDFPTIFSTPNNQ